MDHRGLRAGPPPADNSLLPDRSALGVPRGPSPGPSLRSTQHPATPDAQPETGVDYFDSLSRNQSVRSHASVRSNRSRAGTSTYARAGQVLSDDSRRPSIRIRRRSNASFRAPSDAGATDGIAVRDEAYDSYGRPRSISQPERAHLPPDSNPYPRHSRRIPELAMPRLTEEGNRPTLDELNISPSELDPRSPLSPSISMPERGQLGDGPQDGEPLQQQNSRPQRLRSATRRLWPGFGRRPAPQHPMDAQQQAEEEYDERLVDWLDTIDPEVQTLSTLTNVQNSLFIPDLGHWINRRPTYNLSQQQADQRVPLPPSAVGRPPSPLPPPSVAGQPHLQPVDETGVEQFDTTPTIQRSATISSRLTDSHYAALPHGQSLEGWTAEEKWELDDHVRHMLHSRRSRFKRRMKGFGQYVRRPLGFLVTLYATLITLFGLAWVLFLIGWIYVGDKQVYVIHIIDSVLVALFAIMGDGLAPFRTVDTWRMIHIVRYTRIIENAKKGQMPRPRSRLQKKNVPPEVRESMDLVATGRTSVPEDPDIPQYLQRNVTTHNTLNTEQFPALDDSESQYPADQLMDLEDGKSDVTDNFLSALTPKQQKKFLHHKKKLAKSHSFYKPNETFTHYAFPLKYLIAIVVLLDCHSLLQISLGATTWGIDYHVRPFAVTTVILCVSITCNVTAGIVISMGDRKTRKKDVMNLLNRQELTGDAIKHMREKRKKEDEGQHSAADAGLRDGSDAEGHKSDLKLASRTDSGTPDLSAPQTLDSTAPLGSKNSSTSKLMKRGDSPTDSAGRKLSKMT